MCEADETDRWAHSMNQRQQVLALPLHISVGNDCHGMPVQHPSKRLSGPGDCQAWLREKCSQGEFYCASCSK